MNEFYGMGHPNEEVGEFLDGVDESPIVHGKVEYRVFESFIAFQAYNATSQ